MRESIILNIAVDAGVTSLDDYDDDELTKIAEDYCNSKGECLDDIIFKADMESLDDCYY